MKQIVLLLGVCLLVSFTATAQRQFYTLQEWPIPIDPNTGEVYYRDVVDVEGVGSDKLYSRAKTFFFRHFNNAKDAIQVDDAPTGMIAGKGRSPIRVSVGNQLLFGPGNINSYYVVPLEIRVKDGRYRYEINNIEVWVNGLKVDINQVNRQNLEQLRQGSRISRKQYEDAVEFNERFLSIVRSLEVAMKSDKDDF